MLLLLLLLPTLAHAQPAPPPATVSVLPNGDLSDWADLSAVQPGALRENHIADLKFDTGGQWPRFWDFAWEGQERGAVCSGEVARDETVTHGGKDSVRLTNHSNADITLLAYRPEVWIGQPGRLPIKPNMRYVLRWWVKGKDIPENAGTALMLGSFGAQPPGGPERRVNVGEPVSPPHGTFDWQQREVRFVTTPDAKWFSFTLQLRDCTGTCWYADAELIEDIPVTPVPTY